MAHSRDLNPAFKIVMALVLAAMLSAASSRNVSAKTGEAQSVTAAGAEHQERSGYVGDAACRSCHADKVDSFHRTAHSLTSAEPGEILIPGDFTPGSNILKTSNPDLYFKMEKRQTDGKRASFFVTAVEGAPPDTASRTERIAVVVGSGDKGQTYLYWAGDQLFELPVSYWAKLGWVNSPGYRDGYADFHRPVFPRCLECHATYFESLPGPINQYNPVGYALGIQCEVCHGPGQKHVELEKSKPGPHADSGILNPARFSRDSQMDLCAWCHAPGRPLQPSFSYHPGEPLYRYIQVPPPDPYAQPDVHGNQVGMLELSLCYRSSQMTCMTCHDNVHATQHDLGYFSRRCLSCHKPDSATFSKANHPVTSNCIDCHMPVQKTNMIVFDQDGRTMDPVMRSHWIKVYPESQAADR